MSRIENMTDRELLVENSTDLKNLCLNFESFKASNEKEHAEIFRELRKKVPMSLFFFVMAIIISCMIGLATYSGAMKEDVIKNTTCIGQRAGNKTL